MIFRQRNSSEVSSQPKTDASFQSKSKPIQPTQSQAGATLTICSNIAHRRSVVLIIAVSLSVISLLLLYLGLLDWYFERVYEVSSIQGPCMSDIDCNLGGVCSQGTCHCEPTWRGKYCQTLNLLPSVKGARAYSPPRTSAWGGDVIMGPDGKFHMFVSEMVNGCDLMSWTHNSQIVHSVSDHLDGPYTFQDVALGPFHHNPTIRRAPEGGYLLFFIGTLYKGELKHCMRKDPATHQEYESTANTDASYWTSMSMDVGRMFGIVDDLTTKIGVAYSTSLSGPWIKLGSEAMPVEKFRPSKSGSDDTFFDFDLIIAEAKEIYQRQQTHKEHQEDRFTYLLEGRSIWNWDVDVSNPSPLILPDGSVLLAYKGQNWPFDVSRIGLARAPHWSGPYARITDRAALFPQISEDPVLWFSEITGSDGTIHRRFHMLLHTWAFGRDHHDQHHDQHYDQHHDQLEVNTAARAARAAKAVPGLQGGRAFSLDGINWNFASQPAYTTTVPTAARARGKEVYPEIGKEVFMERQRPNLFFPLLDAPVHDDDQEEEKKKKRSLEVLNDDIKAAAMQSFFKAREKVNSAANTNSNSKDIINTNDDDNAAAEHTRTIRRGGQGPGDGLYPTALISGVVPFPSGLSVSGKVVPPHQLDLSRRQAIRQQEEQESQQQSQQEPHQQPETSSSSPPPSSSSSTRHSDQINHSYTFIAPIHEPFAHHQE